GLAELHPIPHLLLPRVAAGVLGGDPPESTAARLLDPAQVEAHRPEDVADVEHGHLPTLHVHVLPDGVGIRLSHSLLLLVGGPNPPVRRQQTARREPANRGQDHSSSFGGHTTVREPLAQRSIPRASVNTRCDSSNPCSQSTTRSSLPPSSRTSVVSSR